MYKISNVNRMSGREIAEIAGKEHNKIIRDIRDELFFS